MAQSCTLSLVYDMLNSNAEPLYIAHGPTEKKSKGIQDANIPLACDRERAAANAVVA